MIMCSGCAFNVNETMKFALMNNVCPSCGNALFTEQDSIFIQKITSALKRQKFASKFNAELLYDISLFMFNEFTTGLGPEIYSSIVNLEIVPIEIDKDAIRNKVKNDILNPPIIEDEEYDDQEDDNETYFENKDPKIEALKRQAERQANNHMPKRLSEANDKDGSRVFVAGKIRRVQD